MNDTLTSPEAKMHRQLDPAHAAWEWKALLLLLLAVALLFSTHAFAAEAPQKTFVTPDEAVNALVAAVKADDAKAIRAVLGNDPGDLSSGDAVADGTLRRQFVASYDAKHALVPTGDATTLIIGNDDFPFAFPLVKTADRWRFDTQAGKEELRARRIGENELDAIKVLQAIVDAERDYASADRNGNGVPEYAMKFTSSPGKHDGLYWPTKEGEPPSPLGLLVAKATSEGYQKNTKGPTPYRGYYYRLLKGQGANAQMGALDYVVRGRAIGGFAVVAYPAKYGSSGIMTFIVNQDGKVLQTDLGPNTMASVGSIQRYNPDNTWTPAGQK